MPRRTILAEQFGIPVSAWDTIVGATPKKTTVRAAKQGRRAFRILHDAADAISEFLRLHSSEVNK